MLLSGFTPRLCRRAIRRATHCRISLFRFGRGPGRCQPSLGPYLLWKPLLECPCWCHDVVTRHSDTAGQSRTHMDVFSLVGMLGRRAGTALDTSNQLPKVNTRVRFPSSAPPNPSSERFWPRKTLDFHLRVVAISSLTARTEYPKVVCWRRAVNPWKRDRFRGRRTGPGPDRSGG